MTAVGVTGELRRGQLAPITSFSRDRRRSKVAAGKTMSVSSQNTQSASRCSASLARRVRLHGRFDDDPITKVSSISGLAFAVTHANSARHLAKPDSTCLMWGTQ